MRIVKAATVSWMENFKITKQMNNRISVSFTYGAKTVNPLNFEFDVAFNPKANTTDSYGVKDNKYIVYSNYIYNGQRGFDTPEKLRDIIKFFITKVL